MTDGSSQGMFLIVAVVIFGIFISISYILYKNTLLPNLTSIFKDSTSNIILSNPLLETKKDSIYYPNNYNNQVIFISDIDISVLGDTKPLDTLYIMEFEIKTSMIEKDIMIYTQNGASQKYQIMGGKNYDKSFQRIDSLKTGEFVKQKILFKLKKTDYGEHSGKSTLAFYSANESVENSLEVKNVKIYQGIG